MRMRMCGRAAETLINLGPLAGVFLTCAVERVPVRVVAVRELDHDVGVAEHDLAERELRRVAPDVERAA